MLFMSTSREPILLGRQDTCTKTSLVGQDTCTKGRFMMQLQSTIPMGMECYEIMMCVQWSNVMGT